MKGMLRLRGMGYCVTRSASIKEEVDDVQCVLQVIFCKEQVQEWMYSRDFAYIQESNSI
jgi:hypothetical protein